MKNENDKELEELARLSDMMENSWNRTIRKVHAEEIENKKNGVAYVVCVDDKAVYWSDSETGAQQGASAARQMRKNSVITIKKHYDKRKQAADNL